MAVPPVGMPLLWSEMGDLSPVGHLSTAGIVSTMDT